MTVSGDALSKVWQVLGPAADEVEAIASQAAEAGLPPIP